MTTVHSLRSERMAAGDVRIDRQTEWGNPFVIGRHGTRDEVVRRYENRMRGRMVRGESGLREKLATLHGKRLFCWCAPLNCHGNVLAKLAAELVG